MSGAFQQSTWANTLRIIGQHGSLAAYHASQVEFASREEARRRSLATIFTDWTEAYGRSRQVGDKVLFVDFAGILSPDPEKLLRYDAIQMLTVTRIEMGRGKGWLYTDHGSLACPFSGRGRRGTFYIKSGKNVDMPTGQGRLHIPAPGFDLEKAMKGLR